MARIEARLKSREVELDQARNSAREEKDKLTARVAQLEQALAESSLRGESLVRSLEKRNSESTEMKARFEKDSDDSSRSRWTP